MHKIFTLPILLVLAIFNFVPTASIVDKTKYYYDTGYLESAGTETLTEIQINFDRYTSTEIIMERRCPNYKNVTQLNSCAPMAASIVVGYYDYECPNLIPDFEAGFYYNGTFRYKAQNMQVIQMKETLYTKMGTNTIQPGTSVSQFKSGLTSYVNEQGYSISYLSCGSSFNITTAKSYLEQQKPIVLFVNSYKYYHSGGISVSDNQITMLERQSGNGHVAVAYGYREYTFYQGSSTVTNKYLLISYGDGSQGLLLINNLSCIDEAYAISIT